ncbi:MAG: hypothetical protein AB8I08_01370 [Sandaracinaceae bacterium]
MGTQTLLLLDEPFVPCPVRTTPRVWVQRVQLFGASDALLRDIELTPGLNVIWAPDAEPEARLGDRIGHGAGKTLLCRLIRHVLGEVDVARPDDAEALIRRMPEGFVRAQLVVSGVEWTIERAFDPKRPTIALRNEEEAEYSELLDALRASVGSLGTKVDPWLATLAWASRDQERRFAGALAWRDRNACPRSRIARVANHERAAAVRSMLGLRDADDVACEQELAGLEARERAIVQRLATHEREIAWLGARFARELPDHQMLEPLSLRAAVKELEAALETLEHQEHSELTAAQSKYETALQEAALAEQRRQWLSTLGHDPCGLCHTQAAKAPTARARERVEKAHKRAQRRLGTAKKALVAARETSFRGARVAWAEARDRLARAHELERHLERRTALATEREAVSKLVAKARDARDQSAKRHGKRLGHSKRVYDFVVRRLAGQDARGRLRVGPSGVEAWIELIDGRRGTSPAMQVLAGIALDFTALIIACEDGSSLPGLWIHDSPREADLARSHYEAIFRLVAWLEERTAQPGFQYLITSTTRPPTVAAIRAVRLGAARSEDLLLGQRL